MIPSIHKKKGQKVDIMERYPEGGEVPVGKGDTIVETGLSDTGVVVTGKSCQSKKAHTNVTQSGTPKPSKSVEEKNAK
jgi:hypothetical protein